MPLVLLRIGHDQRPFLAATEDSLREADQDQKLRESHYGKYTRAARRELSRNFCQRLPVESVSQSGGFLCENPAS